MRTACPICGTVFRITPEQLRIRAGKVRCGQCHSIFNALESLVDESPAPAAGLPTLPQRPPAAGPQANPAPTGDAARPAETLAETSAETPTPSSPGEALAGEAPASAASEFEAPDATAPEPEAPEPAGLSWPEEPESEIRPAATPAQTEDAASLPAASAEETAPSEESPEESTQAARQAGLVAARELAEAPGYNRWSAGTLAASPLAGLAAETPRKPVWPFVLAALFLGLALAAQLAGGPTTASALVKVALVQPLFEEVIIYYQSETFNLNLYAFFRAFWGRLPEPFLADLRHRTLGQRRAVDDSAHPPLLDRLQRIQDLPDRSPSELDVPLLDADKIPAAATLGDAEAVEQALHDRLFRSRTVEKSVFHRAGS